LKVVTDEKPAENNLYSALLPCGIATTPYSNRCSQLEKMSRTFLISIIIFAFSLNVKGQSKLDFCEKWDLEGYIYWGITFSPEDNEKNDYLKFNENGTFHSVDEGKSENGTWKWVSNNKSLYLYNNKTNEPLIFKVIELTKKTLIVLLEDDEDSIKLKFSRAK